MTPLMTTAGIHLESKESKPEALEIQKPKRPSIQDNRQLIKEMLVKYPEGTFEPLAGDDTQMRYGDIIMTRCDVILSENPPQLYQCALIFSGYGVFKCVFPDDADAWQRKSYIVTATNNAELPTLFLQNWNKPKNSYELSLSGEFGDMSIILEPLNTTNKKDQEEIQTILRVATEFTEEKTKIS